MSETLQDESLSVVVLREMKRVLVEANFFEGVERETVVTSILIAIQHSDTVRDRIVEHFVARSYPHLTIRTMGQLKAFEKDALLNHYLWFEKRYINSRADYARNEAMNEQGRH